MTGSENSINGPSQRREQRPWRVPSLQFTLRELGLLTAVTAIVAAWCVDRTRLAVELERPRIEETMLQQEANRLHKEIQKAGVNYLGGN